MSQPYNRVFNFSPGPCTLPVPVLEEIRDDMLNYKGTGMSIIEHSHRGKVFEAVLAEAQATLAELIGLPDNYKILFLPGGASMQNTLIPMNLMGGGVADYVVTGTWGKKSQEAAALLGPVNTIWDGKSGNYSTVPDLLSLSHTAGASYLHFTSNETVQGVEFQGDFDLPNPVVCDMSSDILSRPMDPSKYAMIYAGAQKNMGPAGVAVVILRDDMIERSPANMQPMLDYRLMAENNSMYNTPPCFAIYVCGLVYQWVRSLGGLSAMHAQNQAKAKLLYDAVDASSGFYAGHAEPSCRSLMNVTFRLPSEELTDVFVKEAKAQGLDGLKGHRSVGGCRASIYNAFPAEGCQALSDFMRDFAARNG